ncbi:MAG TPA: hypothetical protein VHX11_12430, partial [Acidobacteriaceae bacterium]|nr:hypothetical protein [Acidobacteriaceae bacterium]
ESDKQNILTDAQLKNAFEKVSKALTKNEGLREFQAYLMNHEDYLSQIGNVDKFKENVLKSYLKTNYDLYEDLLAKHDKVAERERTIRQEAIEQKTLWSELIDTFNSRFVVPFRLVIQNPAEVLLGREGIRLGFIYKDAAMEVPMEEGALLRCLSQGERRAYYILQVLFEVSIRKKKNQETLLVIDDIADSFDYQNKYAILHYLIEVGEDHLFKQIIMTHNFDFFRSILGRARVRDNSFIATKGSDGITLKAPEGINNPFVNVWKREFFGDDLKKIASICFLRNLIEYTKGDTDTSFKTLTSLLHCKPDSGAITIAQLDDIFTEVCGVSGTSQNADRLVVDVIMATAKHVVAMNEAVGLEHKIVLSIASRFVAERYMIAEINDRSFTNGVRSYQTQALLAEYRNRFPRSNALRVLDRVALMTPENIHLNSFMFEPIIDMADTHLRGLYKDVCALM